MRTVMIGDATCYDYDNWKEFVYAPEEEFDEVFVIFGNRDFKGVTNASWYQDAIKYISDNDLREMEYEIMEALQKLFPGDQFDLFVIRGCSQGEWQNVICKRSALETSDYEELKEDLADFYFGYVTEIYDEEENYCYHVSNSEMWKHKDNLKEFVRELFSIDGDFRLLKQNGFTKIPNWEVVF